MFWQIQQSLLLDLLPVAATNVVIPPRRQRSTSMSPAAFLELESAIRTCEFHGENRGVNSRVWDEALREIKATPDRQDAHAFLIIGAHRTRF